MAALEEARDPLGRAVDAATHGDAAAAARLAADASAAVVRANPRRTADLYSQPGVAEVFLAYDVLAFAEARLAVQLNPELSRSPIFKPGDPLALLDLVDTTRTAVRAQARPFVTPAWPCAIPADE